MSTAYQVHHQTIEQQLERLRAYMEQQGLVLSEQLIVRDDSYGGARLNRPGWTVFAMPFRSEALTG